ncbi:SIS domain-containing protein [Actinomadura sp. 7K534]|uniref:D-sedoheptulose-7-phosphate isomerase n=1 Tax=Actinomadura sp. 7K534 TaxID=2530366 RepID=UPI00104F16DC|nr:SIS domain-containing protein [Actinomadura sp. 7K534]TDB96171.1 SIS domain-containing protein [Actinomadura sp. 7K534]
MTPVGHAHVAALVTALERFGPQVDKVERWGTELAGVLTGGARLLAAGNGGSAAHAQHLTAELVGRYRDERVPLSAATLHADMSTVTAVGNDYGYDEVFARQVRAHGRTGDVLVLLSTSGASRNLLQAADQGRRSGLRVWALTGPDPNPLAGVADEAIAVDAPSTACVQEVHQVVVHLLCAAVDAALGADAGSHRDASALTRHATTSADALPPAGRDR